MSQSSVSVVFNESPDLMEGRRVLDLEAAALQKLSNSLGPSFIQALDILQNISGRIIITGMGKSGHVAHKIAATLASTGSPAFFVHPAEASHGDLGMISKNDAIVALSNSGDTVELYNIIHYTRRYHIPLIAMTSRFDSSLAQEADCALILPAVGEACPIGLAPTTSTTMMMALGDAIATSLLRRNGFSPSDFSVFHPGGILGQKLQKVSDIMHYGQKMPLVHQDAQMSEALVTMTQRSFGCVGVHNDEGKIIGVITDGDLRRHMDTDLVRKNVCDVMTENPKFIRPSALVAEAVHMMNASRITSLFVSEDDTTELFKPIGILHIHDCLRAGER